MKQKSISLMLLSKYRQTLMAMGILLVMYCHTTLLFGGVIDKVYSITKQFAQIGVDFFIFLSGIGIYNSLNCCGNIDLFLRKRFSRTVIPYILVLILWGFTQCFCNTVGGIKNFIYSYSLVTFYISGVLAQWYPAAILVLYVLSPMLFKIIKQKPDRIKKIIPIVWSISALYFVLEYGLSGTRWANAFSVVNKIFIVRIPLYIVGLYFGKMIAEEPAKEIERKKCTLCILIGVCLFLVNTVFFPGTKLWFSQWYITRGIFGFLCIPILLILSSALAELKISNRWLSYLGMTTYELYLIHEKVLAITDHYFQGTNVLALISNVSAGLISLMLAYPIYSLSKKIAKRIM